MEDLFGENTQVKEFSLSIYCDERKIDSIQHPNKENWIYIALLMIPDSKKQDVLDILKGHRENKDSKYGGELKFHDLPSRSRHSTSVRLAKLWLQEVIHNADDHFYFRILGIKKDNLLFELFGPEKSPKGKYANIYNRFFRTAFMGALNLFFPADRYEKILVSGLFHHQEGQLEKHDYFPWHLCYKVADDRVRFVNDTIQFISSNHNTELVYKDDSQLVQLVDLLVGSISHCLDLLTKSNKGKNEVAKVILPLLRETLIQPGYKKYPKYNIQFFLSRRLTIEEIISDTGRIQDDFFLHRRLLLDEHLFGRQTEFDFQYF